MDFLQRLKHSQRQKSALPKRTAFRPLSQALAASRSARASQATQTQTTKRESQSSEPSLYQPAVGAGASPKDDWSRMREAITEDVEFKDEPIQGDTDSESTDHSTSNSNSTTHTPSSTPDTDVIMAPDEVSQEICVEPSAAQSTQPYLDAPPLNWDLGDKLTHVVYSRRHQDRFDYLGLTWAVQWEIARLVSMHNNVGWDDIPLGALDQLCGTSAQQAPRVADVLLSGHQNYQAIRAQERTVRPTLNYSPWDEYDMEEESIRSGSETRLGCESAWFGGKVDQIVRLTIVRSKYKFTLQPPTKSKSCRFRRYTGSRRLLEVRFSETEPGLRPTELISFFKTEGLVVNGRVFRAFYAKKNGIHLVETNEESVRAGIPLLGDDKRFSLEDFIQWHNPLYASPKQPQAKWASRFALGFSDSQPGISFAPANILFINDIVAPGQTSNSAIMTDGSGFINQSALYQLMVKFKWPSLPVCVQARFGGSKGLFILHPSDRDQDAEPRIYIRPSQVKVKLHPDPSRWCPSQRILDVLIRAPLSTGIQITDQIIMNLAHNGVSTSTLDALTQNHIQSIDFMPLMHRDHLAQLWDTIYNTARVQESKIRGLTPVALARAQGVRDFRGEDETHLLSSAKYSYENDPNSGVPPNYETQALGLLQAGFDWTFPPLFKRLESIHKQVLFGVDEKCHLRIPDSALAFVIPDPLGVLEEGEVYCGFKQPVHDSYLAQDIYCVTGPVVVTRNPCILPSDARKVMAVDCPQLWTAGYRDVIVFSTRGKSSQASILGGGDYDGDTVIMIWDHVIVNQFINSPTHYPDVDVSNSFDLSRGLVENIQPHDHESVLNVLLAPLMPTQVGMYGNWHVQASKLRGLDDLETVRLGNIFATCLDGVKSGLTIHSRVVSVDSARWNNPDSRLPRKFTVIEDLRDALDTHRRECERAMNGLKPPPRRSDSELLRPYQTELRMCERVPGLREELNAIVEFVDRLCKEYKSHGGEYTVHKRHGEPRFARAQGGKTHSMGERQETERAVSEAYNRGMPTGLTYIRDDRVARIAASYAYSRDNKEEPRFTFAVAWNELCKIKAEAQGRTVTMVSHISEVMSISRRLRQQLDLIYDLDD